MDLLNATRMQAAYTMGMDKDAREYLVVVVKGTFGFPTPGVEPELLEEQVPLVMADTFTGEPGYSAPVYEADFSPVKHRCDILLHGSAYAPGGQPAFSVPVGIRIGTWSKSFNVIGDRVWDCPGVMISPGRPKPFLTLPITYDRAFGGNDNVSPDPDEHSAYMPNPIGRGYRQRFIGINGTPMPNTEEIGNPVTSPNGSYRPMSFGPIGRGWEPRYRYGGTYDQHWIDEVFPFLPADFDEAYFQAAPVDQQLPFLQGGEDVLLGNLTPEARTGFRIPKIDMPVVFFPKKGAKEETRAVIDTVVIESDLRRFTLTWRVSRPLKRNMFEVSQVLVGKMSRGWWRARELGKTWYPSLEHLANAKKAESEESS